MKKTEIENILLRFKLGQKTLDESTSDILLLFSVSNRRELLIDFCQKVDETLETYGHLAPNEAYIDEYLKAN